MAYEQKRKDAFAILEMMNTVSAVEAKMWGTSIIGVGKVTLNTKAGTREIFV